MKKTFFRLLAVILVVAMMVPLFAACGKKKPAETTGPASTQQTPPPATTAPSDDPHLPQDPTVAKKEALQALLNALAAGGGSADSSISLAIKSELIATLLGDSVDLSFDEQLDAILGSYADTGLSKDLYNTLLTELAKISAAGNANLTIGSNGEVTYTVPADQLLQVLQFWSNSENLNAYLESLASKAENEGYLMSKKAFLDLFVGFGIFAFSMGASIETAPIHPGETDIVLPDPDLVLKNEDGTAIPCTEEEHGEAIGRYHEAMDAFMEILVKPVYDADDVLAAVSLYYTTLAELEDEGYYSDFYFYYTYDEYGNINGYDGHARSSIDESTLRVIESIDAYLASGDTGAFFDDIITLFLENVFYVSFPDTDEEMTEELWEEQQAIEDAICAELATILGNIIATSDGTYEEFREALEALIAYESEYMIFAFGAPLEGFQTAAMIVDAFLLSVNPTAAPAPTEDGLHALLAQNLCQNLGFPIESEDGEASEEYLTLASFLLDLFRAAMLGEELDVEAHADALLALFQIPLTYEEITNSSALVLISKLNDNYDFTEVLLNLNPDVFPFANDEEFLGLVEILDEELFSYLTLDENGAINPSTIDQDRWEALTLALYDYALETSSSMPEIVATALRALITDLFAGEEDAITAFVEALIDIVPLAAPNEVEKEVVVGSAWGTVEFKIEWGITIYENMTAASYGSSDFLEREDNRFETVDEFYLANGFSSNENTLTERADQIIQILSMLELIDNTLAADIESALQNNSGEIYLNIYAMEGRYDLMGTEMVTVYSAMDDASLTEEELALIEDLRGAIVNTVAAYEALFHATDETAEAQAQALCEAYIDMLTAMQAIFDAGYSFAGMEPVPNSVLDVFIAIYSYTLAESQLDANVAILEAIFNMSMDEITELIAILGLAFINTEEPSEEAITDTINAVDALLMALLDPESTADAAKLIADLLHVLADNYTELNEDFIANSFGDVGSFCEEDYQILLTIAMIASLTLAEDVEDYNAYFDGFELPEFIESIDFNAFFQKIQAEGTFTQIFNIESINVTQIFEGETPVGETFVVTLVPTFDIMLASLSGSLTLTFDIVY